MPQCLPRLPRLLSTHALNLAPTLAHPLCWASFGTHSFRLPHFAPNCHRCPPPRPLFSARPLGCGHFGTDPCCQAGILLQVLQYVLMFLFLSAYNSVPETIEEEVKAAKALADKQKPEDRKVVDINSNEKLSLLNTLQADKRLEELPEFKACVSEGTCAGVCSPGLSERFPSGRQQILVSQARTVQTLVTLVHMTQHRH